MNTWDLVKKELAINDIRLSDDGVCQCRENGNVKTKNISQIIADLKKDIVKDVHTFKFLWKEAVELLMNPDSQDFARPVVDSRSLDLFVYSLKDLAKFITMFEDLDNTSLKKIVFQVLAKDIIEFSPLQIKLFPNFKLAIDCVHRKLNKKYYLIDLLRLASGGETYADSFEYKTAKAIAGPWSNLDLPMLERVWPWRDEDENLRGRMRDIRKQQRYRMGLENYNGDGRVGEGFMARELRNEPYSWFDRKDEEPYYQRYVLTRD
tara:strand:+ start:2708 stop:3496 length:789 start_codon:yes stop_codon:yes gene_type:complete